MIGKETLKRVGVNAATVGIALVCLVGCAESNDPQDPTLNTADTSGGVAATVNGVEIGENAITAYVENYRSAQGLDSDDDWGTWLIENGYSMDSLRAETVDYYVNQELMKQAATEQGVEVDSAEVDTQMQEARSMFLTDEEWQQALSSMGMTEEAYRSYVEMSLLQEGITQVVASDTAASDEEALSYVQTYAPMYDGAKRMSQIVFDSDDAQTAQEVLDRINDGELSFADAAQQYSVDSATAENGGDIGWDKLQSSALIDEVQAALDELSKDEVSGLVETDAGIYLIECTDVLDAPDEITSLDQVSSGFVETVREQADIAAKQDAFSRFMNDFKENSDVVTDSMPDGLSYVIDLTPYEEAATQEALGNTTESATGSELESSDADEATASE